MVRKFGSSVSSQKPSNSPRDIKGWFSPGQGEIKRDKKEN